MLCVLMLFDGPGSLVTYLPGTYMKNIFYPQREKQVMDQEK